MGNNLIHNYLNNLNSQQTNTFSTKQREKTTFGVPSVSSTMYSFDQSSDKLIKPLDGKGHLVDSTILPSPKEMVRDTVYTTRALADGIRGKANDHQLGTLNDLGLKIGGLAIATYLMTRKATPKTKAMEFIGFGTFLASMALWPKIALEWPARLIHGFNFRQKYIDDQGRKKFVTQDPNYIPFDLYKGDKKSHDLGVIGDRAGIKRDIPNRDEATKEHMRKVSVQNNTLWMLTVGLASPIMTALGCNWAEKKITPHVEKYSNHKVNTQIDKLHDYFTSTDEKARQNYEATVLKWHKLEPGQKVDAPFENMLSSMKGKKLSTIDVAKLSDTLAQGFDSEMKDAAREDIMSILGGEKYVTNSSGAEKLAGSIHSAIEAADKGLAARLTPDKIKTAASEGIIRAAVKDMLTETGFEIVDKDGSDVAKRVSNNLKSVNIDDINFFEVTPGTEGMTQEQRLAHNIKSLVLRVNNDNSREDFIQGMSDLERSNKGLKGAIDGKLIADSESIAKRFYDGELTIANGREDGIRRSIGKLFRAEAPRGPKTDRLFGTVKDILNNDVQQNRGFVLTDKAAASLSATSNNLRKYLAIDGILSTTSHFKVEKASETVIANNWNDVASTLLQELGVKDNELKLASKDPEYTQRLFAQKLEQVCSDKDSYDKFIKNLGTKMAELDEKLDAPNTGSQGRMMDKLKDGITENCKTAGRELEQEGMSRMKTKMYSAKNDALGVNVGSIMSSKIERLESRVNGVHSTYMRLLQTADFFRRVDGYEKDLLKNNGAVTEQMAKDYGFTRNPEMNKEIIKRGKELLLGAHTNKYYTKMGLHNNKDFFKALMWALYRPNEGDVWNQNWNATTSKTIETLNSIKAPGGKNLDPRRVFETEGRAPLGRKLMDHMHMMFNSMGSIVRGVLAENKEYTKIGGINKAEGRDCKRFDLLGKAPSEMLHDTIKQKANSKKWMKTFAPILAGTYAVTLLAQFFFGKKDPDVKA